MTPRKKCEPGCTCKRHNKAPASEETRQKMSEAHRGQTRKCPPDCTCGHHTRVITDEHRQNIARANRARRGKPRGKCPPGCTCKRHQAYYRGGSEKGRTLSGEAKRNIAKGARGRVYSEEERQRLSDEMKARHADPEWEAKRIEALKDYWANKVSPEDLSRGVKRSSQEETVLAPYLSVLGYTHNAGVGQVKIGRRTPDFIDFPGKRVMEYFGEYWHVLPEEEQEVIEYYLDRGWHCEVIWGRNAYGWAEDHQHLVTPEEHDAALRALMGSRNGARA